MLRQLGHLLLSGIFISGGWAAFSEPGGRVKKVAEVGIQEPDVAVEANGLLMVICGAMLGLDIAPKLAALGLIGSLVPTTVVGHAFWKEESSQGRQGQWTQFLKNLGLLGGLLMVLGEKRSRFFL
jgi:putative oxidoreductase